VFNIVNTLVFIWFTGPIARLVEYLVPDKPLEEKRIIAPKYLDEELIETPSLALERTRLEIGHMGERVQEMLDRMMPAVLSGDRNTLVDLAKLDNEVDILHGHIVTYLGKISRKALTDGQTEQFIRLMDAVNDHENIGDIIETDLVSLGEKRIEHGVSVSEETRSLLDNFNDEVSKAVRIAIEAVMENDQKEAQEVISMKNDIARLAAEALAHQAERLIAPEPGRLEVYSLEIGLIEKLKRIAKDVMPVFVGAAPSPRSIGARRASYKRCRHYAGFNRIFRIRDTETIWW